MAHYQISRYKNGKLKARIQAYGKDPETGKAKIYVKYVKNDMNLTPAKFTKYIEKECFAFEEQLQQQYNNQIDEIRPVILTFPELMREWVEHIHANLSLSYYERALDVEKKFNTYLKSRGLYNCPINKITVRDIQLFLDQYAYSTYIVNETAKLKKPLPKNINFRELSRQNIIHRSVSYNLRQGKGIKIDIAKRLCKHCNIIYEFYFEEVIDERQYAQETVKGLRRILRTVFNEAYRYEWINRNPVCRTKIGQGRSNSSLRPIEEKEIFTIKEVKEFSQALDELPYDFINDKVMVKIMLLCGLRNAELHGLRWTDIDFENRIIHVRRNRLYLPKIGYYEKDPKTPTSKRDVPIPDSLFKDLKTYYNWFLEADKDFEQKLDSYYVAVNIYREPECPSCIGAWLHRFESQHNFKQVSCHGLRHTYCSMLLSQNVPIQTVSKYMGHSDSTVTLQVYSHFMIDTQERAISAINNIFK